MAFQQEIWIERLVTASSACIQSGVGGTHGDVSAKESTKHLPLESGKTTMRNSGSLFSVIHNIIMESPIDAKSLCFDVRVCVCLCICIKCSVSACVSMNLCIYLLINEVYHPLLSFGFHSTPIYLQLDPVAVMH